MRVAHALGILALELRERDVVGRHEAEGAAVEQVQEHRSRAEVTRARVGAAQEFVEQEQHRRLGRGVVDDAAQLLQLGVEVARAALQRVVDAHARPQPHDG